MRYPHKEAMKVADNVYGLLYPFCSKITVAGSLRRELGMVGDIEILLIPDNKDNFFEDFIKNLIRIEFFEYRLSKNGQRVCGLKNKLLVHCGSGIPVDIFSTTKDNWWVSLVVRTGPKESNIRICNAAKNLGMTFNVYGSGFTREDGSTIICHCENDVFSAVGLRCLQPRER